MWPKCGRNATSTQCQGALWPFRSRVQPTHKSTPAHTHYFNYKFCLSWHCIERRAHCALFIFDFGRTHIFFFVLLTRPAEIAHSRRLWWVRQQHHTQVEWVKTAGGSAADGWAPQSHPTQGGAQQTRIINAWTEQKWLRSAQREHARASPISWENINLYSVGHQLRDKY